LDKGWRARRERAEAVRDHFDALREAFVLVHGEPSDVRRPRNRAIFHKFLGFLMSAVSRGPQVVKDYAHSTRRRVMTKALPDRVARKCFRASTVARSVAWPISDADLARAEGEAVQRWRARPVDNWPEHKSALGEFIELLPTVKPNAEERWPIPNNHACLQYSQPEGGSARRLFDAVGEAKGDELMAVATGPEGFRTLLDHTWKRKILLPGAEVVRFITPDAPLKPLAIREMGKIRVVTLHPAEEIHLARKTTSEWLRHLKRVVTTRDMLRNRPINIRQEAEGSQLFSADLTAATDYVPHKVAQHVVHLLCDKLGTEYRTQLEWMMGPHTLPSGERTSGGIHMGLGPTWIVLSLLNSYAAWKAGAHQSTYRVCGDDLIAYWTRSTREKYAANLRELGLVMNEAKSFVGERGVFCERLVTRTPGKPGWAHAEDCGHLSQLTAAKLIAGKSNARLAVADAMEPLGAPVSDRARSKLVPNSLGPGRVRHGGNGFGQLPDNKLSALAKHGAVRLGGSTRLPSDVGAMLDAMAKTEGEVTITRAKAILLAFHEWKAAASGTPTPAPKPVGITELRRMRAPSKKAPTAEELVSQIQSSSRTHRDRSHAKWLLRRGVPALGTKARRRLENTLDRPHAERFLSKADLEELCKTYGPPNWDICTLTHA